MYGDDVGTIVVDPGTFTTKIGYAGEDCPKFVPRSIIGVNSDDNSVLFPLKEHNRRDETVIKNAMRMENGVVALDDSVLETIIEKSLGNEGLRINSADHPILFTEPNRHSTHYREKMVEFAFQKLNVPAVFIAKRAPLAAFSAAKTTALVVDIGHSGTSICPVVEGYALQRTLKEVHVGGAALEAELADCLAARGYSVSPSYAFQYKTLPNGSTNTQTVEPVDISKVDPTFRQWSAQAVIRDIKEASCKVSDVAITNEQLNQLLEKSRSQHADNTLIRPEGSFVLPDGTQVDVAPHAKLLPEALFNPDILRSTGGARDFTGLHRSVHDVLLNSDADVRRELASSILLTGGSSSFENLTERLSSELGHADLLGPLKYRVSAPSTSMERRFASWIGGSILASLGSFQQMWISRAEFEEHGARIVHSKCA